MINVDDYLWQLLDVMNSSVVFNAKKCWYFISDTIYGNYLKHLITPYICETTNPPAIHFTLEKRPYELGIFVDSSSKIYICFNNLEIYDCWKEYLDLNNLVLSTRLKEALLLFTK